ncbi:MAG: response regulator transcription factor [Bacteroidetes bacterium]|jgi:DNA-binding LytR/AlgR family response regulator|nr:response regulator transcription factor [Bacteroidota bacterium]
MSKLKCIIVDDEPLAQEVLERYLENIRELELVTKCNNALEAFEVLNHENIDLMFLDISMPVISGIDFLRSLRKSPAVIITTAHPDFALQGYELDVVDYLVKPVSLERFMKAVNKALDRVKQHAPSERSNKADFMFVKSDQKLIRINFSDISYIEGMKDYVKIFTKEKMIVTLHTMKFFESSLPSDGFIRVHKSYIVNASAIKSIAGNELELQQARIPIGSSYKDQLMRSIQTK